MCWVLEQVNPKRVLLLVVVACLAGMVVGSAVTFAFLSAQRAIPSAGLVVAVGVGVFSDVACSANLTSISWGNVYPGGSVSRIIYVKNTGNAPITLSMATSGWSPAAANGPISIAWSREGAVLAAGQSTAATITLSVSQVITGVSEFSVNIVVSGVG